MLSFQFYITLHKGFPPVKLFKKSEREMMIRMSVFERRGRYRCVVTLLPMRGNDVTNER